MAARAGDDDRIEVLARRVRWLERYRRLVALASALALAPFVMVRLTELLGEDWPGVHAAAVTAIASVVAWVVVEIALALVTAVYETEHYRLLGARGVPRAQLVRRK